MCILSFAVVPRAPEPPAYVAVFNVTRTSLVLKWKAPPNPPGAPVTSYVVSFDSSQGKNWKVLVRNIQGLKYKVQRLEPDTEYLFRVIAVNRIGAGRPSPASRVVRTKKPISGTLHFYLSSFPQFFHFEMEGTSYIRVETYHPCQHKN